MSVSSALHLASPIVFDDIHYRCNEAEVVHDSDGWMVGVAPWALDEGHAERLWEVTEEMLARASPG
ncbi:hypothetical protein [Kutzneria sp. NPDC051319]|uniref:hypothetical protein n=1 Tax=Kutzneria sp. NPDC051319 TaxID=3155047 RepID=UPI00341D90A1